MTVTTDDPLPTRVSLLDAIKDPAHGRWDQFHQTYRGLITGVARRAGLNEHEAEEALQDTLLAVAQKMPDFQYDPAKDSFKGWLLQITRWKIADQFRKRTGRAKHEVPSPDDLAEPTLDTFDTLWETEWHEHRLREALARVKRQVNPSHYAIYHLLVIEERTVAEVRQALGVSTAQIYLAKHRVGAAVRKELRRLE